MQTSRSPINQLEQLPAAAVDCHQGIPTPPLRQSTSGEHRWRWVFLFACAALTLAGFGSLSMYANRPGALGVPTEAGIAGIVTPAGKYSVVMVLHPHCPCSRASLYELESVLGRLTSVPPITFLVYAPTASDEDWIATDVVRSARKIPGAKVVMDRDGRSAIAMNEPTSGTVVVYDPDGRAVFWGGITASRGHAGDNQGADALTRLLRRESTSERPTPVFGCSLLAESPEETVEVPGTTPSCCQRGEP